MTDQYEKHTTHTDALDTLGSVIGAGEKRDAIHLAVEPVEAGVRLAAGTHVVFDENMVAVPALKRGSGVGIVDPFLLDPVEPGERFWLVVYPRQITSLRHVWEHPDFMPSQDSSARPASTKEDAKVALEKICDREGIVFSDLESALQDGGDWITISSGGRYEGMYLSDEVQSKIIELAAIYLDKSFEDDTEIHFSCSC